MCPEWLQGQQGSWSHAGGCDSLGASRSRVLGCSALTFPTESSLSAGAHQAGWVNGVSWKTPAILAPVLAVVSARARWWQGLPGLPAAVPGASEVKEGLEGS